MKYFGALAFIFFVISMVFFVPVFIEYFKTGLVPRFPTLIFGGFMLMISAISFVCGVILHVIAKKTRILEELISHGIKEEK